MNDRPDGSRLDRADVVKKDTRVNSLILSTNLRDSIDHELWGCLPHEGVGGLATPGAGASLTAIRFYPGRNIDSSPWRYTMDPADVLPALAAMKREKTRLGAIVHSHPNTSPVPSPTDLVEARFPSVLSLIVGFSPMVDLRAWRLVYDGHGVAVRFEEVPVVCQDTTERVRLGFLQRVVHNREMLRGPVKGST